MSSLLLDKIASVSGLTWNGAISNSTTGFDKFGTCLDYWSKVGTHLARSQGDVSLDMGAIFGDDAEAALRIVFGLRLISRKPKNGDEVLIDDTQTGFGLRNEFYKAIVWLHHNKPELLYKNLHLIPIFGSWKDFLNEPLIDVLDREKVYRVFLANVSNDLLRKYLPQIRSKGNQRTERDKKRVAWARGLARLLEISEKEYREWKSTGAAHVWQRQMSKGEWDSINFNGIPGKAMFLHTTQKGKDKKTVFERRGQVDRLMEWVKSQKTVKFTGFPYELTKAAAKSPSIMQKFILDRQFETVLEPMRNHKLGNVLSCLDTSGSMTWCEVAPGVQPYDVCLSMGMVFSALNVGYFKDAVCSFSNYSEIVKLTGETFTEKFDCLRNKCSGGGSTNFQSVIDLLVRMRREFPEIPVSEYPETLLVISDMQFNPVGGNTETNYKAAMKKLSEVGLSEVRLIWWFVNGAGTDFPVQMNDKGTYLIGGFDPVNLKALMGLTPEVKNFVASEKVKETPLDGMMNWLRQPIFDLISY